MHVRIDESRHDDGILISLDQLAVAGDLIIVTHGFDHSIANMDRPWADRIGQDNISSANNEIRTRHGDQVKTGGGGGVLGAIGV